MGKTFATPLIPSVPNNLPITFSLSKLLYQQPIPSIYISGKTTVDFSFHIKNGNEINVLPHAMRCLAASGEASGDLFYYPLTLAPLPLDKKGEGGKSPLQACGVSSV